jgi:CRISPR-associated endonuclease/helicase Cas3
METGPFYAHSKPGRPRSEWEPLAAHLKRVSTLAAELSTKFGAAEWGRLAGLWHDLGKYSAEFQAYLGMDAEAVSEQKTGRVDHSTAGAQHAARTLPGAAGRLLAYCIAGHHAGLTDAISDSDACLDVRLNKCVPDIQPPEGLLQQKSPPVPDLRWSESERHFQTAMFCRMVFSSLVDADFLATEEFLDRERSRARRSATPISAIAARVVEFVLVKTAGSERTAVNQLRREVLDACLDRAGDPPGLYSLTVPTGGGKTLSSLAFASRHAVKHGLDRVIYAIPFTSIVEQNAEVFRDALGGLGDAVLEHHSAIAPRVDTLWTRLASENWDAPLIVTTNVQFFETLFAAAPGRCRKLNRIASSVVILDEIQSLPVQVLKPSLVALRELARNYGCSIVLCSATQPAVERRDGFDVGLENVREIVPDRAGLFGALKRTAITTVGRLSDHDLVAALGREPQALCIVNTKRHAARLFEALPLDGPRFHLSASMCPQHRSEVLAAVKARLAGGQACTVISTQVIEAGVDIDFPVVYRAMAGMDSIAQAAGRCNREGLRSTGRVVVFEPEDPIPAGELQQAASTAGELLSEFDDLLSPEAVDAYFALHYWKRRDEWDRWGVLECFKAGGNLDFRRAATLYRLIGEDQQSVIVPWGPQGGRVVDRIVSGEPPHRELNRLIQRFVVGVYPRQWLRLVDSGAVALYSEQFPVLVQARYYSETLGLQHPDSTSAWDAGELIV